MTEQYKPNCCTGCTFADECFSESRIKCADYEIAIKEYNRGLSEGERIGKEKQWKATEKAQKRTSARIRELKKENKEQKEQIEKMKNVGNCRHTMQCPNWVEHQIRDDGIKPCINCVKWELVE